MIRSRASTPEYRDNWDVIFGKKKKKEEERVEKPSRPSKQTNSSDRSGPLKTR